MSKFKLNKNWKRLRLDRISIIAIALLSFQNLLPAFVPAASAGALSQTYFRLNRMKVTTATSARLVFRTATAIGATTATITVDMNGPDAGAASWTGAATPGVVNATQTAAINSCDTQTGFTGLPGTITAAGSGAVITITTTAALAATTTYCVDLTSASAVTTPGTAAEYHPVVTTKTSGAATDSANIAVRTIADDNVVVNAVVPPTFNFVLGSVTDNFASNLSTSSTISTSGVLVTVTTNASSGWITWAKGTNQSSSAAGKGALKSVTAANYTIPTTNAVALGAASHTPSNGTEDYGLGVTSVSSAGGGSGTVTADAAYDGIGANAGKVGVLDTTIFRPIAADTGTSNGHTLNFGEKATIAGITPAANDYTDTITIIGAGRF